jgi:hypothetical protein
MACRNRCSRITARSMPPRPATGAVRSSPSWSRSASSTSTRAPITRRPAARSSASTRRSRSTWRRSARLARYGSCRRRSSASPPTTTRSARTARSHAGRPPRPTPRASRPSPKATVTHQRATTGSATTGSTPAAPSRCAIAAVCVTLPWGGRTRVAVWSCWSPIATCACSAQRARSCASWCSTPAASTSRLASGPVYDVSRHLSPMS